MTVKSNCHGPDYLHLADAKHYHCYRYFDAKQIGIIDATLVGKPGGTQIGKPAATQTGKHSDWVLFSSSSEHALAVSHFKPKEQNFCCIAYPCFDAAVFQPYMGIGGSRNLLRFLWQYYIDELRNRFLN